MIYVYVQWNIVMLFVFLVQVHFAMIILICYNVFGFDVQMVIAANYQKQGEINWDTRTYILYILYVDLDSHTMYVHLYK